MSQRFIETEVFSNKSIGFSMLASLTTTWNFAGEIQSLDLRTWESAFEFEKQTLTQVLIRPKFKSCWSDDAILVIQLKEFFISGQVKVYNPERV